MIGDETVPPPENSSTLEFVDQTFLFESVGVLLASPNVPAETFNRHLMALFEPLLASVSKAPSGAVSEVVLTHSIAAMGHMTKGCSASIFNDNAAARTCLVSAVSTVVGIIPVAVQSSEVLSKIILFLHQMVTCLGEGILEKAPEFILNLARTDDLKTMKLTLLLLNQLLARFRGSCAAPLDGMLSKLMERISHVIQNGQPSVEEFLETEQEDLQRAFLSMVAGIINYDCQAVLTSASNLPHLGAILQAVLTSCATENSSIQKLAFSIFKRMVDMWGGAGFADFDQFASQHVTVACLQAPMRPSFDVADGQCALVLAEIANLQLALANKYGDDFVAYLRAFLPTVNLAPELVEEYCGLVGGPDIKFKTFFKSLFAAK